MFSFILGILVIVSFFVVLLYAIYKGAFPRLVYKSKKRKIELDISPEKKQITDWFNHG